MDNTKKRCNHGLFCPNTTSIKWIVLHFIGLHRNLVCQKYLELVHLCYLTRNLNWWNVPYSVYETIGASGRLCSKLDAFSGEDGVFEAVYCGVCTWLVQLLRIAITVVIAVVLHTQTDQFELIMIYQIYATSIANPFFVLSVHVKKCIKTPLPLGPFGPKWDGAGTIKFGAKWAPFSQ